MKNKREKVLLWVLVGLVSLGGVVILSSRYFEEKDFLLAERDRLETEWITIQTLLEEREVWEARSGWLEEKQPEFEKTQQIEKDIFDLVLDVKVPGVATSEQRLLSTETSPYFTQAGVAVTAQGKLPALFSWLHQLDPPGTFRVIRDLKLAPAKEEPEELTARFELIRWYAPPR